MRVIFFIPFMCCGIAYGLEEINSQSLPSVQEILDAQIARSNQFQSVEAQFQQTHTTEANNSMFRLLHSDIYSEATSMEGILRHAGELYFYEYEIKPSNPNRSLKKDRFIFKLTECYDGTHSFHHFQMPNVSQDRLEYNASIPNTTMRNRRLDKEGNGNFLPFHLFFHFPKANDLILNLSAENGQVTGYKERDGLRCIELEQQPEAGSPQLTYTILFDPERNFLPIQIQLLNRVESPPELFAEYQIHYHDFNGELLPEHWVYLHPEENDDGEAEMRTGKTRMENYVLNKEYSESDFTYTPQPGELIMTDQSEQDDDETEQITFAKLQSDGSLEEIELDHLFGEEGMSPFEYEKTIEKIAGLVLILILAFAVWRQKSR